MCGHCASHDDGGHIRPRWSRAPPIRASLSYGFDGCRCPDTRLKARKALPWSASGAQHLAQGGERPSAAWPRVGGFRDTSRGAEVVVYVAEPPADAARGERPGGVGVLFPGAAEVTGEVAGIVRCTSTTAAQAVRRCPVTAASWYSQPGVVLLEPRPFPSRKKVIPSASTSARYTCQTPSSGVVDENPCVVLSCHSRRI